MSNVISIFSKRPVKDHEEAFTELDERIDKSLADIKAKNKANEDRLKRDRANANKSVLRSYRIKS